MTRHPCTLSLRSSFTSPRPRRQWRRTCLGHLQVCGETRSSLHARLLLSAVVPVRLRRRECASKMLTWTLCGRFVVWRWETKARKYKRQAATAHLDHAFGPSGVRKQNADRDFVRAIFCAALGNEAAAKGMSYMTQDKEEREFPFWTIIAENAGGLSLLRTPPSPCRPSHATTSCASV